MLTTMLEKLWKRHLQTNPKIINLICPACKLTLMCKNDDDVDFWYACQHILFESQVKELAKKTA